MASLEQTVEQIRKTIWQWKSYISELTSGGVTSLHSHSAGGGGDMYKSTYDPNGDGQIAEAQLALSYATHSNSLDHNGSTQDTAISGKTTLAVVKADTDISDAINKKHSNNLDHSNSLDHSHSNKTTLDTYTQTEANLADAVSKKHSNTLDHSNSLDHNGGTQDTAIAGKEPANSNIQAHVTSTHAPSNAQKNSDITKAEIEAKLTGEITSHTHAGGGSPPAWKGAIVGCYGDGSPMKVLDSVFSDGVVSPTPTNITASVARCSFFKLDTGITVNKIRWYGVGATTGLYHVAVYNVATATRVAVLDDFNTAAATWGSGVFSVTLSANTLYLVAVSVDTTGTTAGVLALSPTATATTGQITLPTSFPGNLDIDMASPKIDPVGFCQFAVTTGVLPASMPTLVNMAAWTGGMPAFFLDNNNA